MAVHGAGFTKVPKPRVRVLAELFVEGGELFERGQVPWPGVVACRHGVWLTWNGSAKKSCFTSRYAERGSRQSLHGGRDAEARLFSRIDGVFAEGIDCDDLADDPVVGIFSPGAFGSGAEEVQIRIRGHRTVQVRGQA